MKDEMGGNIVEEFVALKPKLYSILDKGEMIVFYIEYFLV